MNEDTPPESPEERKKQLDAEIENAIVALGKATETLTDLQAIIEPLKKVQTDVEEIKSKIYGFREELISDTDTQDEEGQDAKPSIKSQILETQKQIEGIKSQAESDFSKLKDTLEKEIRSLLPEAGSAGLSSAYFQAKARYGPIPYDKKAHGSWPGADLWHSFKNIFRGGLMNYIAFIAPLLFLTCLYLFFYYPDFYYLILDHSIFIENSTKDEITFLTILLRFLVSTPLVAISLFGWSSIRLQRRLYEEYNHKQRVMQLYVSFIDEIEKSGTKEQKRELLTIMLKTVADKPTLAMTEEDKSPVNALSERLFGKGTSDNVKKKKPSS